MRMKIDGNIADAYRGAHGLTLVKSSVGLLQESLEPGEVAESMTRAVYGDWTGIICVTQRRVVFAARFIATKKVVTATFGEITSVDGGRDISTSNLTLSVAGNRMSFRGLAWRDADRIAEDIRKGIAAHNASPSAADPADRLLKLKRLHDAGVLTDDEYAERSAPLKSLL